MSAAPHVQFFLSVITDEFRNYRDELARHLGPRKGRTGT
jgi:hypothetical protein